MKQALKAAFALWWLAIAASAHPLGNFTINHYVALTLSGRRVAARYVLDMAEIPTFTTRQAMDVNQDGKVSPQEAEQWKRAEIDQIASNLALTVDGAAVRLRPLSADLTFLPGNGGLPTLRLDAQLQTARLPAGNHVAGFEDRNFAARAGWKEIIVRAAEGDRLQNSSVPQVDRSHALLAYPSDALTSPPQDTTARFSWKATAMLTPATAADVARPSPAETLGVALGPVRMAAPQKPQGHRQAGHQAGSLAPAAAPAVAGVAAPPLKAATIHRTAKEPAPRKPAPLKTHQSARATAPAPMVAGQAPAPAIAPTSAGAKKRALTPAPLSNTARQSARPEPNPAASSHAVTLSPRHPATPSLPQSGINPTRPRSAFAALMERKNWTFGFFVVALMLSFLWGAAHALAPGHGKTVVAAYLVGSRARPVHALLLGLTVTATHTVGVFALGLATLFASQYVVPDRLYPWLGFVSGFAIFVIGVRQFFTRYRDILVSGWHERAHSLGPPLDRRGQGAEDEVSGSAQASPYDEPAQAARETGQGHAGTQIGYVLACAGSEGAAEQIGGNRGAPSADRGSPGLANAGAVHAQPEPARAAVPSAEIEALRRSDEEHYRRYGHRHLPTQSAVSLGGLLGVGVTGGLAPCPDAIIVLLSAVVLHRIVIGLVLILAFSAGLATTLMTIGLLMVSSRKLFDRMDVPRPLMERLPLASSVVVAILGAGIAAHSLLIAGIVRFGP